MDIQNIKYNSELLKTKSRLEKELRMVNRELATQRDECEHIRVILDCEGEYEYQRPYNSAMFCLKCATNLSGVREPSPIIDGTFYDRGNLEYLQRLDNIRKFLIKIKENNPEISDKELIERTQEEIDNNSDFSIHTYSKQMIIYRNANNSNLE